MVKPRVGEFVNTFLCDGQLARGLVKGMRSREGRRVSTFSSTSSSKAGDTKQHLESRDA